MKKVTKKASKKTAKPKVYWYASTESVLWMGPYDSQEEAWAANIGLNKIPVKGSMVWCSKVELKHRDAEKIFSEKPKPDWDKMITAWGAK